MGREKLNSITTLLYGSRSFVVLQIAVSVCLHRQLSLLWPTEDDRNHQWRR
jgi:hypothetical protein